jgi:tripartite-type tricarboxylate transporter receptor subunit TctC
MMTAFGGGQLQAAFVTGLDGIAMLQAGKVRYLAVGTPTPTPVVPGLPAIAEEVPGFRSVAWFGVLAPRGVPDAVASKLHEAVVYAVSRPEVKKMFADRNVEARSSSPEELDRMIRDEMAQWGEVAKRANIRLD